MKFGHLLATFAAEEEQEAAHPDFVSYKKLKKCLRAAAAKHETLLAERADRNEPPGPLPLTDDEKEFARILKNDIDSINRYFIEKEEDAVMRLHALNDRRAAAAAAAGEGEGGGAGGAGTDASVEGKAEEAEALRIAFADFHGETVLLLHWSLVNYAGVAKILKKRDKILGGHAQRAYLNSILHQPFTSTENISKLVKMAEEAVRTLGDEPHTGGKAGCRPVEGDQAAWQQEQEELGEGSEGAGKDEERGRLLKRTRAALGMLAQLRTTAHTPSTLLPAVIDGGNATSGVIVPAPVAQPTDVVEKNSNASEVKRQKIDTGTEFH